MITYPPCLLIVAVVIAAASVRLVHAKTPQYTLWTKSIDCGSFVAKAKTSVTGDPGFEQGKTQVITIFSRLRTARLDLQQHSSRDRFLGGLLALDALAWEWRCFHSHSGRDYLFVDFRCVNEDATTCPSAMDDPGTEWNQAYFATGKGLIEDARSGTTARDRLRLRELGIGSKLWQDPNDKDARLIYADEPGSNDRGEGRVP